MSDFNESHQSFLGTTDCSRSEPVLQRQDCACLVMNWDSSGIWGLQKITYLSSHILLLPFLGVSGLLFIKFIWNTGIAQRQIAIKVYKMKK